MKRCLVVEDDDRLTATLLDALAGAGWTARAAASVAEAHAALSDGFSPDLVLLDFALPDGDAFAVLADIESLEPAPRVVVMSGSAAPGQSFGLAMRGVRAYLVKPVDLGALEIAIESAFTSPPDLKPMLRQAAGLVPMMDLEHDVRATVVREALARSRGSRRAAARALSISRQLLQHILRKDA
jgi:two-component system response regulator RegA